MIIPFFAFRLPLLLHYPSPDLPPAILPHPKSLQTLPPIALKIISMAAKSPLTTSHRIALRRLELCAYAVQEIHMELEAPQDPEHKADLLIASENLAFEVLDLLRTVRTHAWGPEDPYYDPDSDHQD